MRDAGDVLVELGFERVQAALHLLRGAVVLAADGDFVAGADEADFACAGHRILDATRKHTERQQRAEHGVTEVDHGDGEPLNA